MRLPAAFPVPPVCPENSPPAPWKTLRMRNYKKLRGVNKGLRGVTGGYEEFRRVTRGYEGVTKGLQGITKGLQGVTRCYTGLQGVTRGYEELRGVTKGVTRQPPSIILKSDIKRAIGIGPLIYMSSS